MKAGDQLAETAVRDDPLEGRVLEGRYRIVRRIGEGGMGAVYEGLHLLINRRVAIKCLHPELSSQAETVERFRREALAANAIGSPHIVGVTDMGRLDSGAFYMVLEYLDGRPWADDLAREGALPLGAVVHVVTQICEALDAAHACGIVHRDLKPANVFLIRWKDDPDFVKLLDFGIAKFIDWSFGLETGITKTGMALGTPFYMAPEQLAGARNLDHRTDLYALGVLLFEALTGRVPYRAQALPLLVSKICHDPIPPLRRIRPDLPPELEALLNRLLAKDPADRPQSCAIVAAALAPFGRVMTAPVVAPEPCAASDETTLNFRAIDARPPREPLAAPVPSPPGSTSLRRTIVALAVLFVVMTAAAAGLATLLFTTTRADEAAAPAPHAEQPRPPAKAPAVGPSPQPPVSPGVAGPSPTKAAPPDAGPGQAEGPRQRPARRVPTVGFTEPSPTEPTEPEPPPAKALPERPEEPPPRTPPPSKFRPVPIP